MAGLTAEQLAQFGEEGYLVVEDVLDPEVDFTPIMGEYEAILDDVATTLYAAGEIDSAYMDLPFQERLMAVRTASGRDLAQHFDFSLPQKGMRTDTPIYTGPAMFHLLTNPRLLDVVESVIGPEIYSSPVQHTRIKPPRHLATATSGALVTATPWHQDNGVLLPEADEANILTVWMPVTEATVANGCLQVVPRSHRVGLIDHCPTGELTIPDQLIDGDRALPLPMRPGSILLLTQRTVHSSLDNTTEDQVRMSFDLRYQPIDEPTGREAFASAGFVARSTAAPERVLRDPATWRRNWLATRDRLAAEENPTFNRWSADAAVCA